MLARDPTNEHEHCFDVDWVREGDVDDPLSPLGWY